MKSLFAIAVVVSLGTAAHADGIRRLGQPGSAPRPVNITRSIFPDTKTPIRAPNKLETGSAPAGVKPGFMRPRTVHQAPVQKPGMAPGHLMIDKIRRR